MPLDIVATRPRPRRTIPGRSARVGRAAPRRLTSKSRHQIASGTSSNRPQPPASPALFTSRSTGPSSSSTRAAAAATASASVTSQAIARPGVPGAGRRDHEETRAPARARASTIATPIPRVPPVTTATWPVRSTTGRRRSGAGPPAAGRRPGSRPAGRAPRPRTPRRCPPPSAGSASSGSGRRAGRRCAQRALVRAHRFGRLAPPGFRIRLVEPHADPHPRHPW